ncbi:MAG TPA: phosphotransferase [Pseudomonadales bacterium]|nr:phosphotransferase [Pseudomonadales bacterium]
MNSTPTTRDAVDACLARAFPGSAPADRVTPIASGWSNAVFAVRHERGDLIVRLTRRDEPPPLGIDRDREALVLTQMADLGLSPRPLHVDTARGELVMPDLAMPELSRVEADADTLARVGAALRVLHAQAPPPGPAFDPVAYAQAHLRRAAEAGLQAPARIRARAAELRLPALPSCHTHNDLNPDNLLIGARVWIVDWELAARGSAHFDLTTLIETGGLDADQAAALYEAAAIEAPDPDLRRRLVEIHALRQYAWALARRALGRAGPEVLAQEQQAAAQIGA